jgi:hypothetical protein
MIRTSEEHDPPEELDPLLFPEELLDQLQFQLPEVFGEPPSLF